MDEKFVIVKPSNMGERLHTQSLVAEFEDLKKVVVQSLNQTGYFPTTFICIGSYRKETFNIANLYPKIKSKKKTMKLLGYKASKLNIGNLRNVIILGQGFQQAHQYGESKLHQPTFPKLFVLAGVDIEKKITRVECLPIDKEKDHFLLDPDDFFQLPEEGLEISILNEFIKAYTNQS